MTNTESPIVVVLRCVDLWPFRAYVRCAYISSISGSMEPAFYRGDLLLLTFYSDPIRAGDICVFKLDGRSVPIVHRVIKVHDK